jgi:hypothetical protein
LWIAREELQMETGLLRVCGDFSPLYPPQSLPASFRLAKRRPALAEKLSALAEKCWPLAGRRLCLTKEVFYLAKRLPDLPKPFCPLAKEHFYLVKGLPATFVALAQTDEAEKRTCVGKRRTAEASR